MRGKEIFFFFNLKTNAPLNLVMAELAEVHGCRRRRPSLQTEPLRFVFEGALVRTVRGAGGNAPNVSWEASA